MTLPCLDQFCKDLDLKMNLNQESDGAYHLVKYDWQMKFKSGSDVVSKSIPDYK